MHGDPPSSPAGPPGRASVLVCVWNKLELTRRCLETLVEERSPVLGQIVVVDNGSTDGTPAYLAGLAAAHPDLVDVLSPGENLGFVRGNNLAAAAASGEYLVFLNNDTVPRPGWLERLVATADGDPSIGAVGAKLVYPDGRLQEAGGIVFADAAAANYGHGEDPDAPRFAFRREVDYCSAACLLVRGQAFRALGGLDERYAPAYYEDTDLCFGLRDRGYRVVYEPAAEVVHHEGGTAGTDTSSGFKRYQVVNRQQFREKWAAALAAQHPPGTLPRRASDRAPGRRLLIVAARVPDGGGTAGALVRHLLELRRRGDAVTLLAIDGTGGPAAAGALRAAGVEVYAGDPTQHRETAEWLFSPKALLRDSGFELALLGPQAAALDYAAALHALSPDTTVAVVDADGASTVLRDELVAACAAALQTCEVAVRDPVAAGEPVPEILVIADLLPVWDRSSGAFRLLQIVEAMRAEGARVTFLARGAAGAYPAWPYIERLEAIGVDVIPVDPQRFEERFACRVDLPPLNLESLLRSRPWSAVYIYFHDVAAQYLDAVRRWAPGARVVVDSVDLHFLREARQAALDGDPATAARAEVTKATELAIYRRADCVVAVTEPDRAALLTEAPDLATAVIPNIHVARSDPPGFATRRDLLFVGGFRHLPNVDAVRWLDAAIWPRLASRLESVLLHLVGDRPPEKVRAVASERVRVAGYVHDLEPYLSSARVSIAPLRYGAGMKGKVGEALAAGLPVVATSVAAEGMGLEPGRHALVADDAAAFADAVVRLYEDGTLWTELATAGRELVRALYAPDTVGPLVVAALANPPELATSDGVVLAFADRLLARPALLEAYVAAFGGADPLTLAIVAAPEEVDPLVAAVDADVSADLLVVPRPTRSWELTGLVARADAVYSDVVPAGYEAPPRFDVTTLPALRRFFGLDRAEAA